VSTSVVRWSEGLSNRLSIIIRIYIGQMKFSAYMAVSFINFFPYSSGSILYHCIYSCMFCVLFNFVNYVFLLVCCSVLRILSRCIVLCIVCV
jgi:hypothetical protein